MSVLGKKFINTPTFKDCPLVYTKLQQFQSVENGVASVDTRFEEFDFRSEDKHFDFRVFSMSNLQAVGADKNLQPLKFTNSALVISDNNQKLVNEFVANVKRSSDVVSEQE